MAKNLYYTFVGLLVALFFSASSQQQQQQQQKCYTPQGSLIGDVVRTISWAPCNGGVSSCCQVGDSCMSNGLCFGSGLGVLYRGGCTDSTWSNSTVCPTSYCNNVLAGTWANLWRCPATTGEGWWCGNETSTQPCQQSSQMEYFSLNWGDVHVVTPEAGISAPNLNCPSSPNSNTTSPMGNLSITVAAPQGTISASGMGLGPSSIATASGTALGASASVYMVGTTSAVATSSGTGSGPGNSSSASTSHQLRVSVASSTLVAVALTIAFFSTFNSIFDGV